MIDSFSSDYDDNEYENKINYDSRIANSIWRGSTNNILTTPNISHQFISSLKKNKKMNRNDDID